MKEILNSSIQYSYELDIRNVYLVIYLVQLVINNF